MPLNMQQNILNTQIAIIGAGPAGLTLALLLQRAGIDCIILELRSRVYAESRVRGRFIGTKYR